MTWWRSLWTAILVVTVCDGLETLLTPRGCICPSKNYTCEVRAGIGIVWQGETIPEDGLEHSVNTVAEERYIADYGFQVTLRRIGVGNYTSTLHVSDLGLNETNLTCRGLNVENFMTISEAHSISICVTGPASSPIGLSVVWNSSSAAVSFQSPVYGGECVEYYVATAVSEERNVSCNISSGEDSLNCKFSLEGNANDYLFSVYGVTRVNESYVLIGNNTSDCSLKFPENISVVKEECGLATVSWESSKSESVNRTISWRDSSGATHYERVTGSEDSHQLNFTDTGPVEVAVIFSTSVCNKTAATNFSSSKCPSSEPSNSTPGVTDTAQPNTDAGDQTTLIAVSAAVGAGLVVILAAGLAGLAALTYYWLVKRKRHKHGSSSGGGEELKMLRMKSTSSSHPPYTPPPAVPEELKAPDVVPPLYADLVQVEMEKEQVPTEHMYHVLEGPSPETEQQTEAVPVTQDIPLYSVVDLSKKKRNRDTNSSTIRATGEMPVYSVVDKSKKKKNRASKSSTIEKEEEESPSTE